MWGRELIEAHDWNPQTDSYSPSRFQGSWYKTGPVFNGWLITSNMLHGTMGYDFNRAYGRDNPGALVYTDYAPSNNYGPEHHYSTYGGTDGSMTLGHSQPPNDCVTIFLTMHQHPFDRSKGGPGHQRNSYSSFYGYGQWDEDSPWEPTSGTGDAMHGYFQLLYNDIENYGADENRMMRKERFGFMYQRMRGGASQQGYRGAYLFSIGW